MFLPGLFPKPATLPTVPFNPCGGKASAWPPHWTLQALVTHGMNCGELPVAIRRTSSIRPYLIDSIYMAKGVGFEPALEFPLSTLSRRAPLNTRPSPQGINWLNTPLIYARSNFS